MERDKDDCRFDVAVPHVLILLHILHNLSPIWYLVDVGRTV